jgi:hypothetical protein
VSAIARTFEEIAIEAAAKPPVTAVAISSDIDGFIARLIIQRTIKAKSMSGESTSKKNSTGIVTIPKLPYFRLNSISRFLKRTRITPAARRFF